MSVLSMHRDSWETTLPTVGLVLFPVISNELFFQGCNMLSKIFTKVRWTGQILRKNRLEILKQHSKAAHRAALVCLVFLTGFLWSCFCDSWQTSAAYLPLPDKCHAFHGSQSLPLRWGGEAYFCDSCTCRLCLTPQPSHLALVFFIVSVSSSELPDCSLETCIAGLVTVSFILTHAAWNINNKDAIALIILSHETYLCTCGYACMHVYMHMSVCLVHTSVSMYFEPIDKIWPDSVIWLMQSY